MAKGTLALLLCSLLLGATVSTAVAPAAAASPPRLATVVAPKGELLTTKTAVVRVRVRPGARMQATIGARDVTRRFGPPRRGVRTARLRRGKELTRGLNHLGIRSTAGRRADFDSVAIVVARRQPRFLIVRGGVRRSGAVIRATWRGAPKGLRANLNGRDVTREFLTGAGTAKPARLGPDDGLRFGRNRLVVVAYDHDGRFDREVRRLRIRRSAPLVAAGPDRTSTTGLPLRLDARSSRAARGGRLRFRWTIVRRPAGSTARLVHATTARPSLVPDVRGRYRLRLRVVEEGAGRTRRGGRAAQLQQLSAASTMDVLAPALPGPVGYQLSTIPGGGNGIQLGGTNYPTTAGWVQVVLLDRRTLEPRDAPSASLPQANHPATGNYAFGTGDAQLLRTLLTPSSSGIDATFLVVMTGGGRAISIQKPHWQALTSAFGQLGGTMAPFLNNGKGNSDPGFGNGNWSLVGIPGLTAGAAAQNWNLAPTAGGSLGDLRGFMTWDSQKNYTFAAGAYQEFDTNVSGQSASAGGTNQMAVSDATYTSSALGAGESGFHVVVVDAGTLEPLANQTFVTNAGGRQVPANVTAMANLIQSNVAQRADVVFLIQSIGAPNPLDRTWTGSVGKGQTPLATAIGRIGGTPDAFNSLAATGAKWGYALVGGPQLSPSQASEQVLNPENPTLVPPPARLHGILKRDDQYAYVPTTTSSFDSPAYAGFDLSALALAFQPETDSWPTHDAPAHRAAEDFIARAVFYPDLPSTQRGYDLHTYYWHSDWDNSAGYSAALANVCPSSGNVAPPPAGSQFTATDLQTVCTQIRKEFVWVEAVYAMESAVDSVLLLQMINGPNSAHSVATSLTNALKAQAGDGLENELLSDMLLVVGTLLTAASEAIFASGVEEDVPDAAAIGAASGLFDMLADFTNSSTGAPQITTFDAKASDLGYEIQSSYGAAINSTAKLSQLLVGDYAKLSVAGPKAQDPDTWGFSDDQKAALGNGVELSTTRFLWRSLLPDAFRVYNLGAGGRGWNQVGQGTWTPKTYSCYENDNGLPGGAIVLPFHNAPSSTWQNQTVGIKHGKPYRQPNLLGRGYRFVGNYTGNHALWVQGGTAPSNLISPLFKPVIEGQFSSETAKVITQVGFNRPELFDQGQGIFRRVNVAC